MAKGKAGLTASAKAIDPTLNALFAGSSGPVTVPSRDRYAELLPAKKRQPVGETGNADSAIDEEVIEENDVELSEGEDEEDDESLSELEDEDADEEEEEGAATDESDDDDSSKKASPTELSPENQHKDRKRKRRDEHDDIEGKYMRKLAEEEEREEQQEKRRKGEDGQTIETPASRAAEHSGDEENEAPLVHESLREAHEHIDVELDKANRTLFLGNVSTEAITSSKAKKLLISHLESPLSELDSATGPHKIESLRFRSTPFSTGSMPKRAAFITKALMSTTTKSTNAYAVYSSPLATRTALKALNGSVVLDRHLRVDSVAHPAAVAHRRCVFVGNLGFVDDETVVNTNAEGDTITKKRHKVPSDTEEGLWRVFGEHAGKVESVRVPRDDKTRVGKGFAYVQFYDGNDVESALLLDGKKFPPLLPRALRVSRAKDPRKTSLAMERTTKAKLGSLKDAGGKGKATKYTPKITPEQQSQAGRAGRLFGRATAAKQLHGLKGDHRKPRDRASRGQENGGGIKPPEQFIFEGRRASSKDKPKDLKFGKTRGKKGAIKAKTKGRGARRAAEWRKSKA